MDKTQKFNKLKRQLENLDDFEIVLEKLINTVDQEKKKKQKKIQFNIDGESTQPTPIDDHQYNKVLNTPCCSWMFKEKVEEKELAKGHVPRGKNIAMLKKLHEENLQNLSEDLNYSSDSEPSDETNKAAELLQATPFTEETHTAVISANNQHEIIPEDIVMGNSPIDDYDNDKSSDYVPPTANEPPDDYVFDKDDNNDSSDSDSDDDDANSQKVKEEQPPPLPPKAKYRIKLQYWKKNRHLNEHEIVDEIPIPYLSATRDNVRVFNRNQYNTLVSIYKERNAYFEYLQMKHEELVEVLKNQNKCKGKKIKHLL